MCDFFLWGDPFLENEDWQAFFDISASRWCLAELGASPWLGWFIIVALTSVCILMWIVYSSRVRQLESRQTQTDEAHEIIQSLLKNSQFVYIAILFTSVILLAGVQFLFTPHGLLNTLELKSLWQLSPEGVEIFSSYLYSIAWSKILLLLTGVFGLLGFFVPSPAFSITFEWTEAENDKNLHWPKVKGDAKFKVGEEITSALRTIYINPKTRKIGNSPTVDSKDQEDLTQWVKLSHDPWKQTLTGNYLRRKEEKDDGFFFEPREGFKKSIKDGDKFCVGILDDDGKPILYDYFVFHKEPSARKKK